jgi:hypothetical protein
VPPEKRRPGRAFSFQWILAISADVEARFTRKKNGRMESAENRASIRPQKGSAND